MTKTILITGVSGFIGSSLAQFFFDKGFDIHGVDVLRPRNEINLKSFTQINLMDRGINELLSACNPDLIIHCAGSASVFNSMKEPAYDFNANVVLTHNILENIRRYNSSIKFIFMSSAAVYGNPTENPISEKSKLSPVSPYGYHKLLCENLCRQYNDLYNIPVSVLRVFSAYGIGLKRQVIWDVIRKTFNAKNVELLGTGNESRDFIYIRDICRAVELVADKSEFQNSIYNVANGIEIKISELADIVVNAIGNKKEIVFTNKIIEGNPINWKADISKIKNIGYQQEVNIESGINKTIEWAKTKN